MKRGLTALAVTLLAGSGLTVGVAAAQPPQGLNWARCPEKPNDTSVECATLTVPVDWDNPATGTITVAAVRRPATGQRLGTLMFMPGGPGDSGVKNVLDGNTVPPAVASRFDVVSYDQRGTNRSTPVRCELDGQPEVVPDAGATLAEVRAYSRKVADSCRRNTKPAALLDHVDNVSVAHDIDALRAALGERKITLYGRSYGTLAGQMYLENFPHRVRGMVLDSVFDHSLDTRRFLDSHARTAEDSFTEFANWCAADAGCALHGQDVRRVYRDLYDRSVRGELGLPPIELVRRTIRFFYGPDWAGLATWLTTQDATTTAAAQDFTVGSFCADHRFDIRTQREWLSLWRRQNHFAPTMRAHFGWLGVSLCAGWPARVANPQHRTEAHGGPPVLLMNSRHDPATSYENVLSVAKQLDGSAVLTYDGWGHGVMDRTECTRDVFIRYVIDRQLPARGTHCPAA